jgi:hypothetical protein
MEKTHSLCSKCGVLHYRISSHWSRSQVTAIAERSQGVPTSLKVRSNFIDDMVTNPTSEFFLPDEISLFKRVIIIENEIPKHAIGLQHQ